MNNDDRIPSDLPITMNIVDEWLSLETRAKHARMFEAALDKNGDAVIVEADNDTEYKWTWRGVFLVSFVVGWLLCDWYRSVL